MRAVVTGVSSCTGSHIARAFSAAGFETLGLLTSRLDAYTGLKRARLATLRGVRLVEEAALGTPRFIGALAPGPDVFVHHGSYVENHRSLDYDIGRAFESSALLARPLAESLAERRCGVVLFSGSYYEPNEGEGDWPDRGVSPYAVSKSVAYQFTRFHLRRVRVPLVKIVIPNPIGPGENEDRLLPYLLSTWRRRERAEVRTPALVRDQLPVTWLADAYVRAAQEALSAADRMPERILRPSGFVGSVGSFVARAAQEVRDRLGLLGETVLGPPSVADEPLIRRNPDPCLAYLGREEGTAWDEFWTGLLRPAPKEVCA